MVAAGIYQRDLEWPPKNSTPIGEVGGLTGNVDQLTQVRHDMAFSYGEQHGE